MCMRTYRPLFELRENRFNLDWILLIRHLELIQHHNLATFIYAHYTYIIVLRYVDYTKLVCILFVGGVDFTLLVGTNMFMNNTATDYGGALALQPNSYFLRTQPQPVFFVDKCVYLLSCLSSSPVIIFVCTFCSYFEGNEILVPSGGIFSSHFFSVTFQGTNTFIRNIGSCLRVSELTQCTPNATHTHTHTHTHLQTHHISYEIQLPIFISSREAQQ